jgi:tRNA G18 (ribose-2'-O)-methylase SpoU
MVSFRHPDRAVYLLGNEQIGLSKRVLSQCHSLISLPGHFSLNVAVAGSIVMYDRVSKGGQRLPECSG